MTERRIKYFDISVGEMPGEFRPEFKVVYGDQKPDGQGE